MKKNSSTLMLLAIVSIFVLGVMIGRFYDRLTLYRIQHKQFNLLETTVLSDTLFELQSENIIRLADTITFKSRNLLVFWSPTCSYSKQFFLHQLNDQIIGIYCFPLTDDWEYLNYYVDRHQITYPQIVQFNQDGIRPINNPSITAVPTFIVVDSLGKQIANFVGINEMDNLMNVLYHQYLNQ